MTVPGVSYRRDDATERGEGWPRALTSPFTLSAGHGPFSVLFDEQDVNDVSFWAATAGYLDGVVLALAADQSGAGDQPGVAMVSYLEPNAARALAAQLLTAADAVEEGEQWDPNMNVSDPNHVK